MRSQAAALAVLLVATPAVARPPEVVRWQDAAAYVGEVVAVEGTVARARVANGACTLEFSPDDPAALRVVLMLALFSSPTAPEQLYGGRRVRASGRIQSFRGRPEMILRRADQIELLDDAGATTSAGSPSTTSSSSSSSSTASTRPSPEPAPVPPVPVSPSAPAAAPSAGGPSQRCVEARERLEAARRDVAARAEDAARCLRAGTSACQAERDTAAGALEGLRAREADAARACE